MESRITEHDIQAAIYGHIYRLGWHMFIPNSYFFDWESDYLAFNGDGQVHEFEIKTSRADFLNDLKKIKHLKFCNGRFSDSRIPNFFTFVLPCGFARRYDVPEYAGVMEWYTDRGMVRIRDVRQAKEMTQLHTCEGDLLWIAEKSNEKMVKAWL